MGANGTRAGASERDDQRRADCDARAALLEAAGFRWNPASRGWLHPNGRAISVETLGHQTPEAVGRWIETGVLDET